MLDQYCRIDLSACFIVSTEIEKGKLYETISQYDFTTKGDAPDLFISHIKDINLLSILQNSSSKVVDENGEPLPVWHITSEDFTIFDISKSRHNADIPAFFFAPNKEDFKDMGDQAIQAFLNIKNPVEKPDANMNGAKIREELEQKGYDGMVSTEDGKIVEYAAFSPNQIKSATDNTGSFDTENEDIRFRNLDKRHIFL